MNIFVGPDIPKIKKIFRKYAKKIWKYTNKKKPIKPEVFIKLQIRIADDIKKIEKRKNQLSKEERDEYRYYLKLLRILGDTLAWHLFSPYWIRQQCKHDHYADLVTNKGFKYEITTAQQRARDGQILILNEITNCLNVADLTVYVQGNTPQMIEVKYKPEELSKENSRRHRRQKRRMKNLYKLHSDKAELTPLELKETFHSTKYGDNCHLIRLPTSNKKEKEKTHYGEELNSLLCKVRKDGKERFITFDGITGYQMHKVGYKQIYNKFKEESPLLNPEINEFIKNGGSIATVDVYERHYTKAYLPPLTKIFEPKIATDLIFGDLILLVIINSNKMAEYFHQRGIEVVTNNENHFLKTKIVEIKNKHLPLNYPLEHLMYATHTTEYVANYVLNIRKETQKIMGKMMGRYPGWELIDPFSQSIYQHQ